MIILTSRNIKLKTISFSDTASLYSLILKNKDYIGKWIPIIKDVRSQEDEKKEIRKWLKKERQGESFHFGIWYNNELVGMVSLEYIHNVNKNAELGYWLSKDFQGLGIATDSCRFLIDFAFKKLKLHRIEVYCAKENKKSCNIPTRLGFHLEGTLRKSSFLSGEFKDLYLFSMLENEWDEK